MELFLSEVDHWAYSIWSRSMGEEEVDEGVGLTFEPIEPDGGLVDVARLVPSGCVVRGEVGVGVGSWGGLGVLAQEVPQIIVDDFIVGVVPTSACSGGEISVKM